jgi:hypothetical protein
VFTSYSLILGAEFDDGSRVTNIAPRQDDDNPFVWEVVVTYSTLSQDEDEQDPNPLLRPADVVMSSNDSQVAVEGVFRDDPNAEDDQLGGPVANAAGEIFDPPPMMDVSRPVLTITRNEATVNSIFLMGFANSVNAETFFGAQPRQLKMSAPQFRNVFENGLQFWTVTYQMEFRTDTWDSQIVNQGTFHLNAGSTVTTVFTHDDGTPRLGNLTTDGFKLAVGADTTFVRSKIYKEKFFSTLGLESSLNVTI